MSTAVSTLITKARAKLNETSTTFYTEANLISWADDAQKYIVTETNCLQELSTASLVTDQQAYALPSDYQDMDRILYEGERLFRVDKSQIDELELDESEHSGIPEVYYIWKDQYWLFPIPSSSESGDTLKLYYYNSPAELTLTTSTLEIDSRFVDSVVTHMVHSAFLKDKEFDMADWYLAQANAKIKSVMIKLNEKQDGHYRMKLGQTHKWSYPLRDWKV